MTYVTNVAPFWAPVWSSWSCSTVVPLLSVRQVISSCILRQYIVNSVHPVLSAPWISIMGPRFFILYTEDLADVAAKHAVNLHAYADDIQLYIHCRRSDTSTGVVRLGTEVGHWMSANCLKLNADRTELLSAGPKYGLASFGSNRQGLDSQGPGQRQGLHLQLLTASCS